MTSAVVVAHPDDEVLWLSPAVASANRLVFCFGDPFERPRLARARRRAVAALRLPNLVDLRLPESGAGFSVEWSKAHPTEAGIEIADPAGRVRYEANAPRLTAALRQALADCDIVFTHNPWGEYGHAEHIQVYRAVMAVQAELGFVVWFSNYVGRLSWPFALRLRHVPCWTERRTVRPDRVVACRLMGIYRRHHAWTWTPLHRWPAEQAFHAQPPEGRSVDKRPMAGEWLLDVAALRPWPTPWRPARRFLPSSPDATRAR